MKEEKTETRIMKLFGENYEKTFTFDSLKGLLPKNTRREKLVHSLQILKRQKKVQEIDIEVFQLLPSAFTKTKPETKSKTRKQDIVEVETDINPKPKLKEEVKLKPFDIEGILDITHSGAMFVTIEGHDKDAIIRGNSIPAFSGDKILVRIDRHKEGKRAEAKFIKVIEYKLKSFIGKLNVSKSKDDHDVFFVSPVSAKASFDFYISSKFIKDAKHDDYVEIEFLEWNPKEKNPRGKVTEVLKNFNPNELEMRSILLEREFHQEFSDEVNAELEPIQAKLTEKDLANRLDLRDTLTITIDPKSARDFDDALSVKKLEDNLYQIGVHIADVAHYVKANTELDKEAYRRATSVYLPDRVAPMLPEKLSNELCSLNPNVDRLAFSMIYTMNTDGEISDEFLAKTIIHSDRRFSYEEAQVVIETGKGDHEDEIGVLFQIAKIWREKRFETGSINFHSSEVQFVLDEDGKPIDVIQKIQREANWMIEEYMLRANISVARALSVYTEKKLIPAGIYRDHDVPDMTKLEQFRESALTLGGHKLKKFEKPTTAAKTLNEFLKSIEHLPESDILNQLAIRSMAKAYYSTVNIGHYGLAFSHYSHFTSPIRRYPDLLAHRLLTDVLRQNKIATTAAQLEEMCQHCSVQEKKATECEREGIKYKQVEYLSYKLKEKYEGIISGIRDGGFWVELKANKCEGYVELASNFKETFSFDPNAMTLTGTRSQDKFYMGMTLQIQVDKVDMETKRVWFKVL